MCVIYIWTVNSCRSGTRVVCIGMYCRIGLPGVAKCEALYQLSDGTTIVKVACCIAFIEYTVEVTSENYILGCCPQLVCQVSFEELFSFIPLGRTRRGICVYKPYSFEFTGDRSARWHSCYVRKLDVVSRKDSSTTLRRTYIVVHRVTVQIVEAGVGDFLHKKCVYVMLINPLSPELNPICYLLALLGSHHFLHVSRIRVKSLTLRRLMSYIYGAPILDVSRSHTTTQHSR